jgi:hypothetical protein
MVNGFLYNQDIHQCIRDAMSDSITVKVYNELVLG